MRIRIAAFLALVVAALVIVVVVAVRMSARDRADLIARFASDRAHQLDEALAEIESELEAIGDDLRLALELSASADTPADRVRELGALIAVAREYRAVEVRDATRATVAQVLADVGTPISRSVAAAIDRTSAEALESPGEVRASPPASEEGRWLRVFALASTEEPRLVVAFVVDTEPILARLRIVAADPGARLLVLGARGMPAPVTDPELSVALERLESAPPGSAFATLVAHLRARGSHLVRVPAHEAAALGLGPHEAVAIVRPIEVAGGQAWSAALLSSTASISKGERALVRRLVGVIALIAVMLGALATFVVVTTRRAVALRERLRRAAEIAHLHEKSEKVFDTIPTGVMVLGADGQVTGLNAALRERVAGAALGGRLSDVLRDAAPESVAQLAGLVDSAKEHDATRSLFGAQLELFGERGTYNVYAVPLEDRFPDARALIVIEDLSMVGSLERQLLRSEKLATIGVLSAGIAHEIGTPLGVARGRAEYMLNKLAAGDPAADGHRIIIEQIDHVSRTIRSLLDFARARPARLEAVDFAHAARAVAELLRLEAERRGVRIEVAGADTGPELMADRDQLQQALVNLVMNALDACDRGGTIGMAAEPVAGHAGGVKIVVRDDGRGISDEDRERVFDPFYTTKKRGQGTGLGLSIVSQIVRDHGGTVELDSAPGRGTTVTMVWPGGARAE